MFQICVKSTGDQCNSFWKVISNDEELLDYNSSHCGLLSAWDSSTNAIPGASQSQKHQSGYQQWESSSMSNAVTTRSHSFTREIRLARLYTV